MTTFTIPGQPQGKSRAKVTVRGRFAHAYTPEKTAAYENLIKLSFVGDLIENAVSMSIEAYYAIPKSMPKYRRLKALSGELKPLTKPDIDNVIKVVCDALNGIAYKDDTQIIRVTAEKFYSEEPRVIVKIEEVNYGETSKTGN